MDLNLTRNINNNSASSEAGSFLKIFLLTLIPYIIVIYFIDTIFKDEFERLLAIIVVNILSPIIFLFLCFLWQVKKHAKNSKRVIELIVFSIFVTGSIYLFNKGIIEYKFSQEIVKQLSCKEIGDTKNLTCSELSHFKGSSGDDKNVKTLELVFDISVATHQLIFGILLSVSTGYIANYFFSKSKTNVDIEITGELVRKHERKINSKINITINHIEKIVRHAEIRIFVFISVGFLLLYFS